MQLNKVSGVGGKFSRFRFAIGLFVVGVIMAVIGGFVLGTAKDSGEYKPVEATITEVNGVSTIDENQYNVEVEYFVDGVKYGGPTISEKSEEGDKFTVYYNVENPKAFTTSYTDNPNLLPIVILVIGCAAVAGGVALFIKGIKAPADQLQQVDMSKFSQKEIDEVVKNKEPQKEYYFHFTGKLNQSYVLETTDRKPVISLNCEKFNPIGKHKYVFKNELLGKEDRYEVGHTTTISNGGKGWMVPCKSTFKVNGQDVFKLIAGKGYSIVSKIEGIKLNFDICHLGVVVASLEAGGVNTAKDKKLGVLGNIPTTGVFTIKAKASDLDMIALIAFAVSRIEFF